MWGRRFAITLWAALAFATWNVVFDRAVALAAADVTRDNVERHLRGEAVPTLAEAYTPSIRAAAWQASQWAAGVLVAGAGVIALTGRSRGRIVHS